MKRFVMIALLLSSAFACAGAGSEPRDEVVVDPSVIELDEVTAPETPAVAPEPVAIAPKAEAEADAVADLIPRGAFADVASFCAAQKTLATPRIAAAKTRWKEEGQGDLDAVPSCEERTDVLAETKTDPFLQLSAVVVETGGGSAAFLLVAGAHGWTAMRTPFLETSYDDPGCGSIERMAAIVDVHEDAGSLVVTTESGRTFYNSEDDNGELTLTYVHACHAGRACAAPALVGTKATPREAL